MNRLLHRFIQIAGLVLLCASAAAAQDVSSRYQSQLIGSRGLPLPNQTIAVCTQPAVTTTQPCSPLATLATSTTTSSGGANPLTSDVNGNFFFYAAPGKYTVQVYGPQVSGQFVQADTLVGAAGPASFTNLTVNGTGTFTGLLNCQNIEGVQCVDSRLARGGIDIGDELNKAYAALPANGGAIWLFPNPNNNVYSYSTPVVFATSVKPVRLECYGATTATPTVNGACVLNYTPTTATAAITLDYGFAGSGSGIEPNHGIYNVTIINNACFTAGGCGSSASGVKIGNTNGGAGQARFRMRTIGFGTGFDATLIPSYAWGMHFEGSSWVDNTLAVNMGGGTENIVFDHGMFVSNGQEFTATGGDTYFYSTSFDGHTNTTGGINLNWLGRNIPSFAEFTDCHFEANLNTNDKNYIIGQGNWKIKGGTLSIDATSGNISSYFKAGGAYISILGLSVSGAGQTATQFIDTTGGAVRGHVEIIFWNFAAKPTICGGGNCSGITDTSYLSDLSNPATIQSFSASALTPNTAGATDLGTTALPWGNLWLGTAATNNFKFQPASTTGARIITIADPLSPTTVGLPLTIASGTSTLTSNATLAATTAQAVITTAGTGILTTDTIDWSYASAPSAGDAFCIVSAYVTAGNVNFVRTNPTAAAQNVSALVINWRVIR